MKKYAIIALACLFLALVSVHLGMGYFHKDREDNADSPVKKTRKTVQISDVPEGLSSPEHLGGAWILFLHYPNETRSVDIMIGSTGTAASDDTAIIDDMRVSVPEDGIVELANETARLNGTVNAEGNHLEGMAVMEGVKAPVPFSAFRIQDPAQGDD